MSNLSKVGLFWSITRYLLGTPGAVTAKARFRSLGVLAEFNSGVLFVFRQSKWDLMGMLQHSKLPIKTRGAHLG